MGLNPRKGTGMAKSLLTPAQAAAIVTDMILTADARVTSPGPKGPGFLPHEKNFLLPAAYAARSTGQPRRSSGWA